MTHQCVSRLLFATMTVGLLSACFAPKFEEVERRAVGGGKGKGGQAAVATSMQASGGTANASAQASGGVATISAAATSTAATTSVATGGTVLDGGGSGATGIANGDTTAVGSGGGATIPVDTTGGAIGGAASVGSGGAAGAMEPCILDSAHLNYCVLG